MAEKTILWVNRFLGRYGGAEENILATAKGLNKKYACHLIYSETTAHGEQAFAETFEKTYQITFSEDAESINQQLKKVMKEVSPDLIFIHNCPSVALMEALFATRLPLIRMIHDHEVYCLRGNKFFPLLGMRCPFKAGACCLFPGLAFLCRDKKSGKLCWNNLDISRHRRRLDLDRKCDLAITNSFYMRRELIQQGYEPRKIEVVYPATRNEVDPSFTSNFSNHNILLFVGQVVRGKGLDALLKALAKVKVPFRLLVLGKGNDLPRCRSLAKKLGIADKVEFQGWVPADEMDHYYRQATMGVVPSVWLEPFGAVGVEMMQHGLPVVAFDTGGINDWLQNEKTGYLVPWMDLDGLAAKITYLLENKEKARELGERGREFALEMFNTGQLVARLDHLFEKMMHVGVNR